MISGIAAKAALAAALVKSVAVQVPHPLTGLWRLRAKSIVPPADRILPSFIWIRLTRVKHAVKNAVRQNILKYLDRAGYTAARKTDFYSPLPSVSDLKTKFGRWYRPSALNGVEYDLDKMKNVMSDLLCRYLREFSEIPTYEQLQKVGYGPGYTAVDALTLYMMIRHFKPRRYIEIGSGLSTYYCSLAAARNASEGYPLAITCIEPNPFEKLRTIPGIDILCLLRNDVYSKNGT